MPKISINILTKDRADFLRRALISIKSQTFRDFDIVLISDGSIDLGAEGKIEQEMRQIGLTINFVIHHQSLGITSSRSEALTLSKGEYIAILDDDDEWVDSDKLKKQAEFLDSHADCVLVGGGMRIELGIENYKLRMRPGTDAEIRRTMLFRNNFFTSTVMFRKDTAIKAGGFIIDGEDVAEDYDLWLRMGSLGEMYNFQETFVNYAKTNYNKARFQAFLKKQLRLIKKYKQGYPYYYWLASAMLNIRILL